MHSVRETHSEDLHTTGQPVLWQLGGSSTRSHKRKANAYTRAHTHSKVWSVACGGSNPA